jgi:hypothetical protein
MNSEFVPEKYTVKGLTDEDFVVCGNLHMRYGKIPCISQPNPDEPTAHTEWIEVNPYTICRNTGIKIGNELLYEFDLISYSESMGANECMGYIVFDEFLNSWRVRSSANYSGRRDLRKCENIRIVGNVILSDADAEMFQQYSDEQEN